MPGLTVCACTGCPHCGDRCAALVKGGRCGGCRRQADKRRPNARARGYDHRWEATAAAYLAGHPRCECGDATCNEPAIDVHHRDGLGPLGPRGHDWTNLQAMAHACHSRLTGGAR